MGGNHDYQKHMGMDTRSVDTAGEIAAESTTVDNYGVQEETIRTPVPGGTKVSSVGRFGMMPSATIPLSYTIARGDYFKKLAERTGTKHSPLGIGSAKETAAYKTQLAMAANYATDLNILPNAQRDYDLFVPMANMAARSYMKTNEIADNLGFTEDRGPKLNTKDVKALAKAGKGREGNFLDHSQSMHLAGEGLKSARLGIVEASHVLASEVESTAVTKLKAELKTAGGRKAEIEQKIADVARYVGYFETAGAALAGGAGFVHDNLSPGKANPAPDIDEIDLRAGGPQKAKSAGEATQKGAGYISKVAAFGVELYHAKELTLLQSRIDVVNTILSAHETSKERARIDAAYAKFEKAALDYRTAVEKYEATISDRRSKMAAIGSNADEIIDKKGGDTDLSDTMLYTTTVMETQGFLDVAFDAANAAQKTIAKVSIETGAHRSKRWGQLSDAYGPSNTPNSEGPNGPDVSALNEMRKLVHWWMEGGNEVKSVIDRVVNTQAKGVLATSGHTAAY